VNRRSPFVVAWLYAPTAAGASSVLMVRFTPAPSVAALLKPAASTHDRDRHTS
jgi:hypothetical protein